MSRHLGKFEKMWNSPCIAIEDPFDLSHNLGAGISRKMNMFIKTAFIRTRELFGIPSPKIPKFHSKIPIEQLKVCLYLQVNLFQKNIFLHQLTSYMTKLFMELP